MKSSISILWGKAISPLGIDENHIIQALQSKSHYLSYENNQWIGRIPLSIEKEFQNWISEKGFQELDRTASLLLYLAKDLPPLSTTDIPIIIGTARGPLEVTEKTLHRFSNSSFLPIKTSPLTTLSSPANFLSHWLQTKGPSFTVSATCASGLTALYLGIHLLHTSYDYVLVGAVDSCLTPYMVHQMQRLGIYTTASSDASFPCHPFQGKNSFVLSEAGVLLLLGKKQSSRIKVENILVKRVSSSTLTGITSQAYLQIWQAVQTPTPELFLLHAPGTKLGDEAEKKALFQFFAPHSIPYSFSPKWKTGHSLGASGLLNVYLAYLILSHHIVPYAPTTFGSLSLPVKRIWISASGFGGHVALCSLHAQ